MKKAIVGAIIMFAIPAFVFAASPTTCTLTASKEVIKKGQSVTLKWTSQNATNVFGNVTPQKEGLKGSVVLKPTSSKTYYLTAMNTRTAGLGSCSVSVKVQ